MASPAFKNLLPPEDKLNSLEKIERKAHESAYNLLLELNSRATKDEYLQICTSESLTAGLIMATLVDIPWGGYLKYGCFGVYDTDAKRVFNGVQVDDVYTHRCAKEMAIGILKNSNATLAIAVTGNAMPLNEHADMLGEVFIGIAGYTNKDNPEIIYLTKSINACIPDLKEECKLWYDTIVKEKTYNPRQRTALVSRLIRNYTAHKALELCLSFVKEQNPIVPKFILERKSVNNEKQDSIHTNIPANKYDGPAVDETCVIYPCPDVTRINRVSTATFPNSLPKNLSGGRRKSRKIIRSKLSRK